MDGRDAVMTVATQVRAGRASAAQPAQVAVGNPRLDRIGVLLGLTLTPLLVPAGPGNTAIADVGVVAAVAGWLVVTRAAGRPLRVPYLLSVTVLISAGGLAILAGGAGRDVLVLAQDVVLLLWAAALAALVNQPGGLRLILRMWVTAGVVSAAITVAGYVSGIALLAGTNAADGSRASATLGDPNLAANWFVLCLLVLRAAQLPRRTGPRWLCCAVLLVAVVITGSNGGMLALVIATSLGCLLQLSRRHGPLVAIAAFCLMLAAAVVVRTEVSLSAVRDRAVSSVSLLNDSVGRTDKSEASRSRLFREALALARTHGLVGLGPGGTREALRDRQAPYVKEAHDDYLAAVVERGALGGLGLVLLMATAWLRLWVVCRPDRRADVQQLLPRPELLGCALLAVAVSATLYEVLHFRHVWALLGLVAGLSARRPASTERV